MNPDALSTLALKVPHVSGRIADLLSGGIGFVLVLLALVVVLVGGWAWETEPPWFTARVSRLWRFVLVPVVVGLAAVTTLVRLFALA